jgi:acetyl esterase/lipase
MGGQVSHAARTAATVAQIPDIVYKTTGGWSLRTKAFLPVLAYGDNLPVLAWYWFSGLRFSAEYFQSKNQRTLERFAAQGIATFSVELRTWAEKPPGWPTSGGWDEGFQDAVDFLDWLRTNAGTYDLGGFIVAGGGSGGGHMAMMTAYRGAIDRRPNCVVNWSGPTDLTEAFGGGERVSDYLGCDPLLLDPTCVQTAKDASPFWNVNAGDPASFLAHSTDEVINVGQARKMTGPTGALTVAGVYHEYLEVAGTAHGMSLDRAAQQRSIDFIYARSVAVPPPPPPTGGTRGIRLPHVRDRPMAEAAP